MRTQMIVTLLAASVLGGCAKQVGEGDGVLSDDEVPGVGWEAVIEGEFHDVGGTAVILDESTIEIRDFTYDGGGINARLFLLIDGEDFRPDLELTDNLVGEPSDGETLTLPLPEGAVVGEWNLITLWCIPAAVSFGAGIFQPPADAS